MRRFKVLIAGVILITAAFLLFPQTIQDPPVPLPPSIPDSSQAEHKPIIYQQLQEEISGNIQAVHRLDINLQNENVKIFPMLSHDSIFGFEKTSIMAQRVNAKAAINAGFFHVYGQPAGITVINGKLLCTPINRVNRPVFYIDSKRRAKIVDMDISLFIDVNDKILKIDGINRTLSNNEIIMFTPEYGLTTRTSGLKSFNIIAEENHILSDCIISDDELKIPRKGLVIMATGNKIQTLKDLIMPFENYQGQTLKFIYRTVPEINNIVHAFEGGFWVVKDGNITVREREAWVGLTTNREPRTIVGVKDQHTVILMAIDGRQPGYSVGLSGVELAHYLLDQGIENALMLDGGASTTMVYNGKIVNKPSYRGRERMVGGAICITVDKEEDNVYNFSTR